MPSLSANSSSVGARCSSCSSFACAVSISRARERTERGTRSNTKLVDDGAADARHREGLEFDPALGLEALDRSDQTHQAVGDEVGVVDVRWQAGAETAGDELDHRRIGDHTDARGRRRRRRPCSDATGRGAQPLLRRYPWSLHDSTVGWGTLPVMREDGWPHTRPASERASTRCRPAWSRSRRGRAAPGSFAGRPRLRADGWRSCDGASAERPRRRLPPPSPRARDGA